MATGSSALPRGAPPAGLPAKVVQIPPNQTLYVRNIRSDKGYQKQDMRTALYMLFSTYGPLLDVVVLKTMKMRGQAHIVFRDIHASTQAMRSLDGFDFFGSKLKIEYAKTKSNTIAKLDGTFKLVNPAAATNVEVTELQHSIFNAPVPGATSTSSGAAGLPSKPVSSADTVMKDADAPDGGRGQKRGRDEEEEEEDSDVAMEEDSDDD
ncbi:hypothetical protein MCOR27_001644 [Pyricularia oryzae]|uniref:RRM domain-containing protein n=5 Tax=Pyricularia TaxID=48558 RepID=A0ABQ8NZ12_PYRGI|nr:U2 small nuclear ribonucleoprotein B [Pyricularia oryzae 70-15]ELQ33250.1 U2 small nuclear ribonucleoprotein B [Pyricularia oryzae Y34]KAH8837618.1 hypothetical protein MCOR01_011225 [Pyricularia oryzae]KAI6303235.1 hypothetical protein MCOR33_001501 [Pyricularia grisea]EHA53654.1 U2 small nuclear ribonucleoprotein B [Pyricularia oryzae 70-15]KAI6256589.1 hypothetical protein MCOR19_006960 [Pyricularia oryzae]